MSRHTPGPWLLVEGNWCSREMVITSQMRIDAPTIPICEIDVDFGGQIGVEQKANATLIAAAPDLLADLIDAAIILRRYESLHRAKETSESTAKAEVNAALANRFEATIARARGEA